MCVWFDLEDMLLFKYCVVCSECLQLNYYLLTYLMVQFFFLFWSNQIIFISKK